MDGGGGLARRLWKVSAGASRRCAGASVLPFDAFRRKIGEPALLVWEALTRHRGEDGLCWPSTSRVVQSVIENAGTVLSRKQVLRALGRLKGLGLIENHGWSTRPDRVPGDVYLRTVRGAVQPGDDGEWRARLPRDVWEAVRAAPGWGGRREGAGRPKMSSGHRTRGRNQTGHTYSGSAPSVREIKPGTGTRTMPQRELRTSSSAFPAETPAAGAAESSSGERPATIADALRAAASRSREPVWEAWPGRGPVPVRPHQAIFWEPDAEGIPRRVLSPVRVPAARPIPEEVLLDEDQALDRMWAAYQGAMRSVAGAKARSGSMPSRLRGKGALRERVLERASWLTEMGTSPEAWFLFWVNRWTSATGRKATTMPFSWAVADARVDKIEWFLSEQSGFASGREKRTPTHNAMDARYDQMMWDLYVAGPKTEVEAKAVVARAWPDGLWRKMVERARAEIVSEQRFVDAMIAEGEWMW